MTNLYSIVNKLRALGLCIIPSGAGDDGKHPLGKWKQYQEKLPTDAIYNSWLHSKKPVLWGIVTGEVSDVIVVDVDPGADISIMGDLKPHVRTPRGGYHYYFKHPGHKVTGTIGILPKIDIRADGSFVNVAGKNPVTGKEYKIEMMPTSENVYLWDKMPKAITDAMDKPAKKPTKEAEPGELIPEGERNDWLFRRACGYRNKGDPEGSIFKKVKIDYEGRCEHDPPMSDKELRNCCHSAAEYEPGADALKLLPFEVEKLIQYGTEDAEYTLVIKGGESIDMGETSALLSPRRTRNRLWERGYSLPMFTHKRWHQITNALLALVEIQPTVTALEETEQWLRNHLSTRYMEILMVDPDNPEKPDSLSKALTMSMGNPIIRDKQGRIYLSLNGIISHARYTLGQSLTQKALAIRLKKIGFERAGVSSDYSGGKHSRVKMWRSSVGFLPPREDEDTGLVTLIPPDTAIQIAEAVAEEERSPLDKAVRKMRRGI